MIKKITEYVFLRKELHYVISPVVLSYFKNIHRIIEKGLFFRFSFGNPDIVIFVYQVFAFYICLCSFFTLWKTSKIILFCVYV